MEGKEETERDFPFSQHLISEMLVKGTDGESKELSKLELPQNLCGSVNHMSEVKD